MKAYKIIENPKGVFKIYTQTWFGYWQVYGTDDGWGWTDSIYGTYESAYNSLSEHMKKDKEKEAFKPRTWTLYR